MNFFRCVTFGSKIRRLFPLNTEGTSVTWYTALNPIPNFPIFSTFFSFEADPTLVMFFQSSSEKSSSLNVQRQGPLHRDIPLSMRLSGGSLCFLKSTMNLQVLAPASSAFCRSSLKMSLSSSYSFRMFLILRVMGSVCPHCSIPMNSGFRMRVLSSGILSHSVVTGGTSSCMT